MGGALLLVSARTRTVGLAGLSPCGRYSVPSTFASGETRALTPRRGAQFSPQRSYNDLSLVYTALHDEQE